MWQYIRMYAHYALLAALFMGGEVLMDLVQPGLMSRIVDDGVLGLHNNGIGNLELVWKVGAQMIGMALIGCCFGSLNMDHIYRFLSLYLSTFTLCLVGGI